MQHVLLCCRLFQQPESQMFSLPPESQMFSLPYSLTSGSFLVLKSTPFPSECHVTFFKLFFPLYRRMTFHIIIKEVFSLSSTGFGYI